jgi:predicted unusual protein kinase regulating ubiquinone biosynthesis (AarF/ABC1/UbiB family)
VYVLQDNVPSFDTNTAMDILQYNLGKPVRDVFEEFDETPIAAASLGQVHLARLNGEKVVVKVQRPGLKDLFDIDLKNIRALVSGGSGNGPLSVGPPDWT